MNIVSLPTTPTSTARSGASSPARGEIPFPAGYPVERGLELVHRIVRMMNGRIPEYLDRDEVMSQGTLGLIAACRSFQEDKGAAFETYATIRIRGAILDWLRSVDRMSRQQRAEYRLVQETVARLEEKLGRTPTDGEVRQALGLTPEAYRKLRARVQPSQVVSLDAEEHEDGMALHEVVEDDNQKPAREEMEQREMNDLLARRIQMLPEREQRILSLYYFQKLSFAEIAEALGFCESRVCQLHSRALSKLRVFLSGMMQGTSTLA